ncbi:MAG TPA: NDP-sugar synthase [Vicinamibacterales bacterium]|nr:NDP-sugar synthase [Vicinamibacterales bacterium]
MRRPPALVLTAGLGTRLRPLTDVRAKGAVPVNGEPLAGRVARWLAAHGFIDQVFNLHHHPSTVTACLGDGSGFGARVRYSWEQPVLGSAGGPRHALPLLTDDGGTRFLIVNGDTLTDVDLDAVLHRHEDSGALVTMALIPNPAPEKYGGVGVTADGFVSGFTRPGAAPESRHFIGVQVAEARAFASLADGVRHESVNALYPELMRQSPRAVAAYVSSASFSDIGTPGDCHRTSLALARREGDHLVSATARVAASAVLERTALWDDVTVEDGVRLTDCIVGDGARVREGLAFAQCAIVPAGTRAPEGDERLEHGLLIRPL